MSSQKQLARLALAIIVASLLIVYLHHVHPNVLIVLGLSIVVGIIGAVIYLAIWG